MALITSDCGTNALLEQQLALITSGCAGELWVEEPTRVVGMPKCTAVRWHQTDVYYGAACLFNLAGESWLAAAAPMGSPYCSCKLTRVRVPKACSRSLCWPGPPPTPAAGSAHARRCSIIGLPLPCHRLFTAFP